MIDQTQNFNQVERWEGRASEVREAVGNRLHDGLCVILSLQRRPVCFVQMLVRYTSIGRLAAMVRSPA